MPRIRPLTSGLRPRNFLMASAFAAALMLSASANAFQAPAALRARPCPGHTVLAAGFGPPKQSKPGNPAPANVCFVAPLYFLPIWLICPTPAPAKVCLFVCPDVRNTIGRPGRLHQSGTPAGRLCRMPGRRRRPKEQQRRPGAPPRTQSLANSFRRKSRRSVPPACAHVSAHAWRARWPLVAACPVVLPASTRRRPRSCARTAQACAAVGAEALGALNADGYFVKDNFLGADACAMMRAGARARPSIMPSSLSLARSLSLSFSRARALSLSVCMCLLCHTHSL